MISLSNLPFVPECLPRQSVLSKFSFGVILLLVTLWKRALLYALHVTKCGCSEAGKPRSLKSGEGELKPSSLIEVDTYGCSSSIGTVLI